MRSSRSSGSIRGAESRERTGRTDDRIENTWLDTTGYALPAPFALGTLPRTDPDVRTPHRNNWDFVAAKTMRFGNSVRGQVRVEVLNVTNTVKVRGPINTLWERDIRSDTRAVRLHAIDAADVPAVVLEASRHALDRGANIAKPARTSSHSTLFSECCRAHANVDLRSPHRRHTSDAGDDRHLRPHVAAHASGPHVATPTVADNTIKLKFWITARCSSLL